MTLSAVQVSNVEGIPLAVVRREVRPSQLSSVVPEGCGRVWSYVRERNLAAGRNVALYWDGAIHLDVGVELRGALPDDGGDVVRSATPAGAAVSITLFGPYGQLGAAHQAIRDWCAAHNHRLAGPSWEIYGHWREEWNADPSQIRTDVFYQLTPGDSNLSASE
jgi:effector-binding domain-containing protein